MVTALCHQLYDGGVNRTERLYALVEELSRRPEVPTTARSLAQRFAVSTRTIKRDLVALQEAGVPLWAESGRNGGYGVLRAGRSLPPVTFTAAEAVAVATALQSDNRRPFAAEANAALTKILRALADQDLQQADRLGKQVWFLAKPDETSAVFRTLSDAMRRHVVVHIDYTDAAGRSTDARPIEPIAFAQPDRLWYLLAWCRLRNAGRWFRVDRIRRASTTREVVTPRDLHAVFGNPPAGAYPLALLD